MFGKNSILKTEHAEDGALMVHSIFPTVQGEGPFAGHSAIFVRLYGCSLACTWCDTEFEAKSILLTPRALMDAVQALRSPVAPPPLIVLTGGEPMRQRLAPFLRLALELGYSVQIETAGIHWQDELHQFSFSPRAVPALSIVCSPKTPKVHHEIMLHACAFKYIVDHAEVANADGLPLLAVSQRGAAQAGKLCRPDWLGMQPERIYVQPLDPAASDPDAEAKRTASAMRCVELVKRYGYRLSLQQHKILGVE